ncbi:MAG: hypothetical protein QF745_08300 [Planctomycetota bacterium]|jgi:hypothetical protein|nr:hypothetical protein [Planctomycetota bacterium]
MSKKKDWKGTEPVAKTAEQHKRDAEYEAMSPEEKKAAHRRQLVGFLNMFQGEAPIMYMNGKPQEHRPMSKEAADLHLALFDGEIEPTPEVRLELAQLEALRWPESKRTLGKLWKAMAPAEDEE